MRSIGIIGLGYWGNIILKTLIKMGETNIVICEKDKNKIKDLGANFEIVSDYKKINSDYIFVITPAQSHFPICDYFLKNNKNVFCEKPLCLDMNQIKHLYKNKGNLFVDWIFLYNDHFNHVKNLVPTLGKLKSIEFNRLNYGPIRNDVNAFVDLTSHDLSMLCSFLKIRKDKLKIINYKVNKKSKQNDSCICFMDTDVKVLMRSSWENNIKNRDIIFNFEKNVLLWNDVTQTIKINGKDFEIKLVKSPLENSISKFFEKNQRDYSYNKTITLKVSDIILG